MATKKTGVGGQLRELAALYRVQTGYFDVFQRRFQPATRGGLLAAVRALGAPVEKEEDVPDALRKRRQEIWQRQLEPVTVAWEGQPAFMRMRVAAARADDEVFCSLQLESGQTVPWRQRLRRLPAEERATLEGARYVAKRIPLPRRLPCGYHRLRVELAGRAAESLLVVAPVHAYLPWKGKARSWGVFLPLYALHSRRSPAGGDLSDLESMLEWAASFGAGVAGSLPLLSAFLDEPFAPGPYSPVSCLFWNEFYLDPRRIPEWQRSPAAQAIFSSPEYGQELQALGRERLVDYRRAMALKRRVLEELARSFFADPAGERQAGFERFRRDHSDAEDYARFRAAVERRRTSWWRWPPGQREGRLAEEDYGTEAFRYHLFVQWQSEEQLAAVSRGARRHGPGLYLDLPLGVHSDGYDLWRYREVFLPGMAGGAPPDDFFIRGQNWGLPPLHPERLREREYGYFLAALRHHLRKAGVLRIDHVMRLHRLFCIPHGRGVSEGVYVRKPAEELYALVTLEAHRHQAIVVGEDLGTVPASVRQAMGRHRLLRSYVLQFQVMNEPRRALHAPPRNSLASFNTHDTRPFAAYWEGRDVQDRLELGLVKRGEARQLHRERQRTRQALVRGLQRQSWLGKKGAGMRELLEACLAYLAASPARIMLVNLEDLWLETEQQNTPGTVDERPNWRRKARYAFEEFIRLPQVIEALQEVGRRRGS